MSSSGRLSELLVRWENLRKQGQTASAEEVCADCPELAEELKQQMQALLSMDRMLRSGQKEGASAPSPRVDAEADASAGPAIPGYAIVRLVDRGGMGEVFVATDEGLHREVALKCMRPGRANHAASRRRFLLEAEITGRLEHPGVVPVHQLLHDKDGQPCYAMRFIQGESLHDAIKRFHAADQLRRDAGERRLTLRQMLSRFITVCNTVAYAHSRGILHRDLKPSNIMLGKYGETLVVDWGLAKPLEKDETAPPEGQVAVAPLAPTDEINTQAGQVVGTPAYMSPEQAAGRSDLVGPASDIFGLGATLYALLVGQAPFACPPAPDAGRPRQLPSPHQVNKSVPRALEAICLKAMALRPEERYPTALDLAADMEQWLAGEPVSAWREPWSVRFRRWARRHQRLVTAAATALLVAFLALGLGVWQISAAYQKERAAKDLADRRAQQARAAVDDYFIKVSENELLNVPGLEPLRKDLVQEALHYYQSFVQEHGQDPTLQAELAAAYFRIAQINAEVGSPGDIALAFGRGLEILEKLLPDKTNHLRFKSLLVGVYKGRRRLALDQLDTLGSIPSGAIQVLEQALVIWQQLVRENPGVVGFQNDLAGLSNILGIVQTAGNLYEDALGSYGQAREIWQVLVHDHPADANFQSDLAVTYANLAEVYERQNQPAQALRQRLEAFALLKKLVREHPQGLSFQKDLAGAYNQTGVLQSLTNQPDQAHESYQQARQILEKLRRDYPTATSYQRDLAAVYVNMGNLACLRHEPLQAGEAYQQARQIGESLLANSPAADHDKYAVALATTYLRLGEHVTEQSRPEEALAEWYAKASALLDAVLKREDRGTVAEEFLAQMAGRLLRDVQAGRARALTKLGRPAEPVRE